MIDFILLGVWYSSGNVTLLLSVPSRGPYESDVHLIRIILVVAKKVIARCWLRRDTPSMALSIQNVKHIRAIKFTTYTFHLQQHKVGNKLGLCYTIFGVDVLLVCIF